MFYLLQTPLDFVTNNNVSARKAAFLAAVFVGYAASSLIFLSFSHIHVINLFSNEATYNLPAEEEVGEVLFELEENLFELDRELRKMTFIKDPIKRTLVH